MATTDLGACEWFVWDLRRSNLIDRGQLDQVVGEFLKRQPRAEPPALAEYLVQQNVLSQFQAERILQGKTQGLVLGPYHIIDSIGSGSMGQVYKALSKTDSQLYAVKVLPRRSMWNVRLARRQVRAFGQFTHPAVVPFVDVGTSGGLHYLVWPLVEGETLEAVVQRNSRLSAEQASLYGLQIAHGLNVCHQNGLFHGLLKPSNVMIGTDGQARILDFGIGSLLVENEGESLVDTMSTANALTSGLDCASPESIMEPTNRTPAGDQYSLGCVLYFCLTGRYPFPEGSAVEKMMAHQFKQAPPLAEVAPDAPAELVAIVEKLMQKSPDNRYSGADEVVAALQPLAPALATMQEVSRPKPPAAPLPRSATDPWARSPGSAHGSTHDRPSAHGPAPSRPSAHGTPPAPTAPVPPAPVRGLAPSQSLRASMGMAAPPSAPVPTYTAPAPVTPNYSVPGLVDEAPVGRVPVSPVGLAALTIFVAALVYFLGANFMR